LNGLPPDSNSDIRTDLSTDCATGTYLIVFPDHKEVSLPVDLFSHPNQFLRARDRAEPATLTTLSINFDFGHHPSQNGMPNIKVQMSNQIQSSNAVTQGFSLDQDQP